jgi:hypothetical protein
MESIVAKKEGNEKGMKEKRKKREKKKRRTVKKVVGK